MEVQLSNVSRQLDRLVVRRLDRDDSANAVNDHVASRLRQAERIGGSAQRRENRVVGVVAREANLLLDVVTELVEAPVRLTHVHAEIRHGGEEEEAE